MLEEEDGLKKGETPIELEVYKTQFNEVLAMLIIKLAQQSVHSSYQAPGECPRCGCRGWHKWGRPKVRSITDVSVREVTTRRYRCKGCGKTITASPEGVSRSRRSSRFSALIGVLYGLGLSHRSIETVLGLFGHRVDHTSSWRDVQKLGGMVCSRLPAGSARVVGVDETWMKVKGKSRPVGVVVDVGGRMLGIELTGGGFDYVGWFERLGEELGVKVVVTDDSTDYAVAVEESGLSRQQCLVHMRRTLGRAKGRLGKEVRERYAMVLEEFTEMVRELPSDGAQRLLRWSANRKLPPELRRLAVHLLDRWRQMTLHQRREGVPESTNWLEGRFGRIKPRYRSTRGLKTDAGALNFMAVVCDVLN